MSKVNIGTTPASLSPAIIAGAIVNGKANYLTLGGCGGMSRSPPLMYITLNKAHYTNAGIKEHGWFSVNVPSRDQVVRTDYVGLVSGKDTDKSGVFTPFYGKAGNAPMIEECPVNILCRVIQTVYMPSQTNAEIFIAEIEEVYVNKECMTDGKPDFNKIKPIMLAGGAGGALYLEMTGKPAGVAYHDGKMLIKNSS